MAVLIAVGTVIGFMAGRAYQVAQRAWSDYKKTQALIPAAQKAFWAALRGSIVIGAIAVVWMVATIIAAASGTPTDS